MKKLLIVLLLCSCGKVNFDDVEIKPSKHEVIHRVIIDTPIEQAERECLEFNPNMSEMELDMCIDEKIQDEIEYLEFYLYQPNN